MNEVAFRQGVFYVGIREVYLVDAVVEAALAGGWLAR